MTWLDLGDCTPRLNLATHFLNQERQIQATRAAEFRNMELS